MIVDREGSIMKRIKSITEAPHFLSGWKEIANYLGKGVRTVQRYEWELGLPVRRPAGKARGSVVATRIELDAWVAASPIRAEFRLTRPMPELPQNIWSEISTGLHEMNRLRNQMQDLRNEVTGSVALLHSGVQSLLEEVNHNRRREPPQERDQEVTPPRII